MVTEGTEKTAHTTQTVIREMGHYKCSEIRHFLCVYIMGVGLEKQFQKNCNLPVKRAGGV